MFKKGAPRDISFVKKLFQSDESRFIIWTALKIASISIVVEMMMGYILLYNVRLNFYFFKAHGYSGIEQLGEAYFQHVTTDVVDALPWMLLFHIIIFFMGLYIGHLILRPFKNIGDYCTKVIDQPELPYRLDEFSDYRLLTRFSEIFFDHLREDRRKGKLTSRDIPPQYMGFHKPVFDGQFLFHFSFFLVIVMIVSIVVIMNFTTDIHERTLQLALKIIKSDPKITSVFFQDQTDLVAEMWWVTAILVISLHLMLGIHLYNQVAGAAFGIFATMRSYLKGNWQSRVHLVGYYFLRDSTRALNKYLDWMQKNLGTKGPPVE